MKEISFISGNKNKARELISIARKRGFEITWANMTKVEIQAPDPSQIAKQGAIWAYQKLQRPLITEDTGLFINALKGFPGPYSSYVYGSIGLDGTLKLMEDKKDRSAYFKSAICYVDENTVKLFEGIIDGNIAKKCGPDNGFDYDMLFIPKGKEITYSAMSLEEKNALSHRAIATNKLLDYLTATYGK